MNNTNIKLDFYGRFPGPFNVQSGTDRVDSTFYVYCTSTAENVIRMDIGKILTMRFSSHPRSRQH